ncbi:MAG TPA: DUF1326 domain-containing protein [Candidatus Saccharimonadaceae bacterium]|jgi:hypothetical protein|nr:DUF1326 domain-containing protein [Candidatus Saccharimonadaceae bacterium]
MKRLFLSALLLVGLSSLVSAAPAAKPTAKAAGEWSMNATIIEACSCPMFCTCYFGDGKPAAHHDMTTHAEEHYCRFNNVFRVNKGNYKGVKLDGAKFWVAGDLGGEFGSGQAEWASVIFDKATTKEQRDGIAAIVPHLYPMKWKAFSAGEGDVSWEAEMAKGEAEAKLDGGKGGEVVLKKGGFGEHGKTPRIDGLQYWAADHNDGFVLMPNSVEAYRQGDHPFEFNGTNGFMITVSIADHSAPATSEKSGE